MRNGYATPARSYSAGIGDAVANRTINRKVQDGDTTRFETWEEVAERVARGNSLLAPKESRNEEFHRALHHLRQASILMSGRHLQHGDERQPERNIEVFTNCATSATSFVTFYLLLNGSGVGRAYDDHMMVVDWCQMPIVVPVIDHGHPDVMSGEISAMDLRTARHVYASREQVYVRVGDSREGWANAIEHIEVMAFEGIHRNKVLILDFSDVRARGKPIGGMQNRPASGPGPLMNAIRNIAALRDANMPAWRATMFVDHYLAECVLVGGARRAARMSTKTWRDASVLDFIKVKQGGFLWSSNNSVTVDEQFWRYVRGEEDGPLVEHARQVLDELTRAAYFDGTGEPGLINQDKLVENREGMDVYTDGIVAGSSRFKPMAKTAELYSVLTERALTSRYHMITNPCGEIALFMLGGYCVIADVVPYHAQNDDDAEDAFRTAVRMLMRTNLMDALYKKEVRRTNRIGVGMTGIHEYAWKRFGYGWKDLVDEERSKDFWLMLARFRRAVDDEARKYAEELGVTVPHTNTTIKPAGTTSKLFGLSEGAHLPSMREYLRWVQFRNDDPIVTEYERMGYPVRKLRTYNGTTIVGFPTQPEICKLGMGDKLVTAGEATPEEQYQWLRLLEKYWIRGTDESGNPLPFDRGNQVSYTLKYNPKVVDFERFKQTLIENQPTIRACSVMPQTDVDEYAYEYVPEQPITKDEYERITREIRGETGAQEDVGLEHVDCASGVCPIDFRKNP